MKYFALVMSTIYVLAGCLFIFTNVLGAQITTFRLPLGLMLVGYGVMRAYIWRRRYMDQSEGE